jgi:hypothetical protein
VLWVNMVTAATLGLVIGIESPEDGVMERRPRRPGKALVGKKVIWRCCVVGVAMIAVVLGNAEWSIALGRSRKQAYTVALNTLVTAQSLYVMSCRFETASSLSWSALVGNPWLTGMVLLNAGLQCLITYTPDLQTIFDTAAIDGVDWARILGLAFAVFLLVEFEKAVGPEYVRPLVMPCIQRNCTCRRAAAAGDVDNLPPPPPPSLPTGHGADGHGAAPAPAPAATASTAAGPAAVAVVTEATTKPIPAAETPAAGGANGGAEVVAASDVAVVVGST